jgi:hypothetical protein
MNANSFQGLGITSGHTHHLSRPPIHNFPPHLWSQAMSRRQFARAALGTFAVGAAFSTGLWKPRLAFGGQGSSVQPLPIPAGGKAFRVFGPGPAGVGTDPIDAEPATITDFNGFLGLAYLSGIVTQTNTSTGEVLKLPFVDADMRFMKGVFRGADGASTKGAFALV